MVNLLGRRRALPAVAAFESAARLELERRLRTLAELARIGRGDCVARSTDDLAGELDELEAAPSDLAARALLDRIDSIRREALEQAAGSSGRASDVPATARRAGVLVCHRPGLSLATGEAEIASRGYFDGQDRPPLDDWIGVLPGAPGIGSEADFWIVARVAPADVGRVRAGCRACPTGSLVLLEEIAPEAARQLAQTVSGDPIDPGGDATS